VLEIDERATSERRVGLEPPIQAREHFPDQHFNTTTTTTTRRQYNHDTLYSSHPIHEYKQATKHAAYWIMP
jgi:hypothetical protein